VFIVPKTLLCNSSAYFKAALNGPFIEGQTQTIDLDDEDPSIFRTYIAWLYQGQLNSQDIQEDLDDPQDFGLHIAEVIVFADKRNICELKNDAISMLMNYMRTASCRASLDAINCIYDLPKSVPICGLRFLLAHEEVWHGHRLKERIDRWHPEFMAEIIYIYKNYQPLSIRYLESYFDVPPQFCRYLHKHTVDAPNCSSLAKNVYTPAPQPAQQPPNKKRKTMPSTQTVELLED
jgi:hypothetical protein